MGLKPLSLSGFPSTQEKMQQNTAKACISDTGSYLRPLLKLDNLPLIYKHVSGNVLHAILALPN